MTERGLPIDGAPACPFVAFEDDRDERATSPDHRHRCFAEAPPAPRALAHQEAYCLSSAFPVCPTFQDWARREAARSRADGPRPSDSAGPPSAGGQPQRNPPRNWSAPPPWVAGGGSPPSWAEDDPDHEAAAHDDVPAGARGLSGSYADRVASDSGGAAALEASGAAATGIGAGAAMGGAAGAAGHGSAARNTAGTASSGGDSDADDGSVWTRGDDANDAEADAIPPPQPRHRDREETAGREGAAPPSRGRRRDPDAPEWERGRPLEAYPTLRSRRLPELSVPPLLVAIIALALAAAGLFALPGLLGFGNPSAVATPTPSAAPSVAGSVAPTVQPEPTPFIYLVKSGDTMSKIAKQFDVALEELIAANAETIPDPDTLQIGDQVIIPVPVPSEIPGASP